MIQFTTTLAQNSSSIVYTAGSSTLSSSTSTPPQSLFAPNIPSKSSWSSSATSVPQNWTLTTQATDGGGDGGNSSFNNASPGPSFSSTMQQTSTVPLHSTTTSTSPVNSTQGAMTSSTSVNQIQSTNLKTSQPRSTYPQNPPRSSSRKLLRREFLWEPFFDLWILRVKWKCHQSSPKRVNLFPEYRYF